MSASRYFLSNLPLDSFSNCFIMLKIMPSELPIQPESSKVSCDDCVAACCRAGAALMLSETEVSLHKRKMNLKALLRPKSYPQRYPVDMERLDEQGNIVRRAVMLPVPQRHGFYLLLADCGYLSGDDFSCGSYDERPRACQEYEIGPEECLSARAVFGLDGHEAQQPTEIRTEPIKVKVPRYQTR
jgi:Fe-S-cluster containining protein